MDQIKCPRCGKRLFDVSPATTGTISTICPRCKTAVVIDHKASEPKSQAPSERH